MRRRQFIKTSLAATAGAFSLPYILPSGRLFAATGARRANHVVFCLFAGGVRNLESMQKKDGNLMRNILNGTESISPDIAGGMDPLPASPIALPLQNYGTLFKEFRFSAGPTGHYNGHITALTGNYTSNDINLKAPPPTPTIFEYYRKHNSPSASALNCWWISNQLGPYPALNYSSYSGYGASYGANFIAPTAIISKQGYDVLGNMRTFTSQEQACVTNIRDFVDKNFASQYSASDGGIMNTDADRASLQSYITDSFNKAAAGQLNNPWGAGNAMNNDMYNIFFAEELMKQYKPELMVVNMQDVDVCHSNFTQYCNNLRKADYAVAHLWDTIQKTPGMANDTVLIIAPEHGRNLQANSIIDKFGRFAIDHTNTATAREIFCLVVGPPSIVKQGQVISTVEGESIEVVPAIANILGFDTSIPGGMLKPFASGALQKAFV